MTSRSSSSLRRPKESTAAVSKGGTEKRDGDSRGAMVALKNDRTEYGRRLRHLVMDALRRTCFCFVCLGWLNLHRMLVLWRPLCIPKPARSSCCPLLRRPDDVHARCRPPAKLVVVMTELLGHRRRLVLAAEEATSQSRACRASQAVGQMHAPPLGGHVKGEHCSCIRCTAGDRRPPEQRALNVARREHSGWRPPTDTILDAASSSLPSSGAPHTGQF